MPATPRRRAKARVSAGPRLDPPGDDLEGKRDLWLAAAAIGVVTTLAFAAVRGFDFVNYDDLEFIVENPHVAGGLTLENIRWAWRNPYSATGGPLTWMSHMLDVELHGLAAGGHHVTNLLLHVLNGVLLLALLRRMTRSTWRSAFVAALFAIHPLHVESVAWIAERKDVLSGLFFLAAIAAYAWYVDRPGSRRYALVAVLFVLGLLSKPMVATLPFVLLLLDVWPLNRLTFTTWPPRGLARLVVEKLPLIGLSVVAMALTLDAQREIGAVSNVEVVPLRARVDNAAISYIAYLVTSVWPVGLIPFYPYRTSIPATTVAGAAGLLLCLTAGALAALRRAPYLAVGWLWFVGMLLPVIGLVQVGAHAMADRFTYLPLIGIFLIVAWVVPPLCERLRIPRPVVGACAVLIVVASAVLTEAQTGHWQNGVKLWEHTVRVDPDNARAYSNLGVALARDNRHHEAIDAYERSLRLQGGIPQTRHNLGLALEAVGRHDEAATQYAEAVRLHPGYAKARMHLANQLAQRGSIDEAIEQYREAIRLQPDEPLSHVNLAVTFARTRRPVEAIPHMLEAVRLEPQNPNWRYLAARMMMDAGRHDEGARLLEQVLALDPSHAGAREALAQLRR